jgi:flagellar hook assembly protein FlgD
MFTLDIASDVTVSVYSILGKEIATLHNGKMIPGIHSIRWNGLTNNGFNVASGVYFYQVDVAGQVKTGKMMLLK